MPILARVPRASLAELTNMRASVIPETVRTRGGATIVNARKVAERYVKRNIDMSQVAKEDEEYIQQICAEIEDYSKKSDLFFKVAKESKFDYTIFISNWRGRIIFTDWVETFQMEDSPPLFHNITGASGNFDSGQIEVTVKRRGIVSTMMEHKNRTVDDPYPIANMTPRPMPPAPSARVAPPTGTHRRTHVPVTPRRSLHVSRAIGKTPRRPPLQRRGHNLKKQKLPPPY